MESSVSSRFLREQIETVARSCPMTRAQWTLLLIWTAQSLGWKPKCGLTKRLGNTAMFSQKHRHLARNNLPTAILESLLSEICASWAQAGCFTPNLQKPLLGQLTHYLRRTLGVKRIIEVLCWLVRGMVLSCCREVQVCVLLSTAVVLAVICSAAPRR